ncbi:MAG: FAD-binding protein [Acidimicrobiales bacterium]|nr:FAD-binding protein [Acidimicrobiales bacterium]
MKPRMVRQLLRKRSENEPAAVHDPVVDELRSALSPDRVRTDQVHRSLYSHDASVFAEGVSGPICLPTTTAEVQAIMRIAMAHGRAVVPRGAGTGLAGGAIPLGAPIVVSTAKMTRIIEVDPVDRVAWVEPGVVNLDLSNHLRPMGFHYAPDPSSQQVCTIGGNVANNSGGPHCLAYGVTDAHVLAVEAVLVDGTVAMLGDVGDEPGGYDLRGAFVGSEGMLGVATRIAVRLTQNPPAVKTMLVSFDSVAAAANTVSAVVAAGMVPAAMEVMDQKITIAVENYVGAGYPRDAAAVLLVELEGLPAAVEADAEAVASIARAQGASSVRVAADDAERAALWKGRKTAFGAIAQIAPDYYLHDTVVPRARLADVLAEVYEIADRHGVIVMNVFHAGDGNLHPLLLFDGREPGAIDRVHAAGDDIVRASLAAGGALSGEHGVGLEKQAHMDEMFGPDDLDHQERLRKAFDPFCRVNPGKVIPAGHSCADIQALKSVPRGVWG